MRAFPSLGSISRARFNFAGEGSAHGKREQRLLVSCTMAHNARFSARLICAGPTPQACNAEVCHTFYSLRS